MLDMHEADDCALWVKHAGNLLQSIFLEQQGKDNFSELFWNQMKKGLFNSLTSSVIRTLIRILYTGSTILLSPRTRSAINPCLEAIACLLAYAHHV